MTYQRSNMSPPPFQMLYEFSKLVFYVNLFLEGCDLSFSNQMDFTLVASDKAAKSRVMKSPIKRNLSVDQFSKFIS